MQDKVYVGRLAPSPTGNLHVGHAFTFYIAMKRRQKYGNKGKLIFRVEDLDHQRCKQRFVQEMIEDLHWMGITWDEGPGSEGQRSDVVHNIETSSYFQSNRTELYQRALELLIKNRFIYPSSHSRKEVNAEMERVLSMKERAGVIERMKRSYSNISTNDKEEIEIEKEITYLSAPNEGEEEAPFPSSLRPQAFQDMSSFHNCDNCDNTGDTNKDTDTLEENPQFSNVNFRFRVPDDEIIVFYDGNFGEQKYVCGKDFGDFVCWTKGGFASYELAVVVDDLAMGVTEVVRGGDLLLSTARQILLRKALSECEKLEKEKDQINNIEKICNKKLKTTNEKDENECHDNDSVHYYHCDLIRDKKSGQRMAKRDNSTMLRSLRNQGWTPDRIKDTYFNVSENRRSIKL